MFEKTHDKTFTLNNERAKRNKYICTEKMYRKT